MNAAGMISMIKEVALQAQLKTKTGARLLERVKRSRARWRHRKIRPEYRYPHRTIRRGSISVGEGTALGMIEIDLTGDVTIGEHCIISSGAKIFTHRHKFLEGEVPNIVEEKRISFSSLKIGDNVYVGESAMILPQVEEIGDNAVIGACAVLTKNVGPGQIWAGNPARLIGNRSDTGD